MIARIFWKLDVSIFRIGSCSIISAYIPITDGVVKSLERHDTDTFSTSVSFTTVVE